MLEEDTDASTYWKKCGDEALEHGIKGIVIMVHILLPSNNPSLTESVRALTGNVLEIRLK